LSDICLTFVVHTEVPIKLAAQQTGLSAHVIRVWEKRYKAVEPARSNGRRRLYSVQDLEKLRLLRSATQAGHRIGDIARLSCETLRGLSSPASAHGPQGFQAELPREEIVRLGMEAVQNYDADRLTRLLETAALRHGQHGFLERILGPFAHELGEAWRRGQISAAHEHFASSLIRGLLLRHTGTYTHSGNAPLLIVTTPAGQLHELGAAMVSAAARDMGWRVDYLGSSLPALEIAGAAHQRKAAGVALSIVHPADDPNLEDELRNLRRLLPAHTRIFVGGRAAVGYAAVLQEIEAILVTSLSDFCSALEKHQNGS
jgi:DNA-binding transcriptional MerR regulator/methylmalonyl-CoA mutase cobalamin-binding subunit